MAESGLIQVPIRPLSKGMILNIPEQLIPMEAFTDLNNTLCTMYGIMARPGYQTLGLPTPSSGFASDEYIDNYVLYTQKDLSTSEYVMTNKRIYDVNASTFISIPFDTGVTVPSAGLYLDTSINTIYTSGGTSSENIVHAGLDFGITYHDNGTPPGKIKFYISSFPGTLSGSTFSAKTLCFYKDRLFLGNTEENGSYYKYRIRWSKVANTKDFSDNYYLDLPYTKGELVKLMQMDDYLIAYFTDCIYIGVPSNIINLPVVFRKFEFLEDGLISLRAVCSADVGHFFFGQTGIYYFNGQDIKDISDNVFIELRKSIKDYNKIVLALDAKNERICVAMRDNKNYKAKKIWSYNYKSQGWSYESLETTLLAFPFAEKLVKWADLSSYTWSNVSNKYPSWADFGIYREVKTLCISINNVIAYQSEFGKEDNISAYAPIPISFSTKDFDFDAPDLDKTITRVSLKIDYDGTMTSNLVFKVEISNNRGRTYRNVGNLIIRNGEDEGYLTMLQTSSHFRLRFSTTSIPINFKVSEMVLKIAKRGEEYHTGNQR